MANEHDALFKIGFGSEDAARSQLRALLPANLLSSLDLSTLRLVASNLFDDGLSETPSDRIYSVRLQESNALVYCLHEHQSTPDPLMPFRLLRYMVKVWEWWLAKQETKPKRLPAVIPVVLYHGAKRWDVATRFLQLIDLPPEALAASAHCLPEFEFVLDDLSQLSDTELRARGAPALASITLLLFKHGRQGEDLLEVWRTFLDLLGELAQTQEWTMGLRAVTRYTYRVGEVPFADLAALAEEAMGPKAREVVVTTAERLLEQGRLEGVRRTLLRLFRKRFPGATSDVEKRIGEGSEAELELWTDRVIDAATLDQVFTDTE